MKTEVDTKTRKQLKKVKKLIGHKKNWTRAVHARDKHGHEVPIASKKAVRFCLLGAAERIGGYDLHITLEKLLLEYTGGVEGSVSFFNDGHKHKEVVAFLEEYT